MIYQLIYLLAKKLSSKRTPVAIKVHGSLDKAIIKDNLVSGMPLLEADQIKGGSISGNITWLPTPKEMNWILKLLPDIIVGLIVALIVYKLGWS